MTQVQIKVNDKEYNSLVKLLEYLSDDIDEFLLALTTMTEGELCNREEHIGEHALVLERIINQTELELTLTK